MTRLARTRPTFGLIAIAPKAVYGKMGDAAFSEKPIDLAKSVKARRVVGK